MLSEKEAEKEKEFPINLPNLTFLVCFPIIIGEKRRGRLEKTLSRRERVKFGFSSFLSMTSNSTGTIIKTAGAKDQSGLEGPRGGVTWIWESPDPLLLIHLKKLHSNPVCLCSTL